MNEVKDTCYTLKMARFIEFYVGEKPRPDNWVDIQNEYIALRENRHSLFVLNMMKEIVFLKAKHTILTECVKILAKVPVPELIDELKIYGYRAEYNWANQSTYTRDLKRVLTGVKKLMLEWTRKQRELDEYIAKHQSTTDKKRFMMDTITLEDHRGLRVDVEQVSVAEWCLAMNRYEKYCEVRNAESKNLIKPGYGRGQNR